MLSSLPITNLLPHSSSTPIVEQILEDASYRLMVEAVADHAVFMLDPTGHVMTWNPGAERIKGYTAAEIIGRHFSVFYPSEAIRKGHPANELAVAAEKGLYQEQGWRIRKDGSRMWARLTLSALRGPDGILVGYGKVTHDLSAQKMAEEALSRSDRHKANLTVQVSNAYTQLRNVTDSISDGIVEVGVDWKILFGNRSAAALLPEFRVGRSVWECFPDLLGTGYKHLHSAMALRTCMQYEHFYPPNDMWLRVRLSPTTAGLAVIFSDITIEHKLQDQLKLEQELKERRIEALSHMAAGLAHEISNPLAIIYAIASDLRAAADEGEPVDTLQTHQAFERIEKMSERAMRILKGLRGFAREADNDPMEWASVPQIVDQCLDMQMARCERDAIDLRVVLDEHLPSVLCRETQIGQIVTNLLNNAADAIGQGRHQGSWIALTASQRGEEVIVRVSDSGTGVPDHLRAHIMDAFFTTKTSGLGIGIGLSLSRAIAEAHSGTLVLLDGQAHTCFQLTLPVDPRYRNEIVVAPSGVLLEA